MAPVSDLHRQRIFKTNKDGSVEIYLQTEAPDQAEQNNWLPLTEGAGFYVVLTVYNPEPSLQTRTFVAPSIERVEEGVLPRPRIVRTMMAQSHASK